MAEEVLGSGRGSKFDKQMNLKEKTLTAGARFRCGFNVLRPTPEDH